MNTRSLVAGRLGGGEKTFSVVDRRDGSALEGAFVVATREDVDAACRGALEAVGSLASSSVRAEFLERVATELEADAEAIVARYQAETALPEGRARGELGRTCGQLRMFARVAREGHWVDARIDHAIPDRQPLPKPDLRSMRVAIGPVAVFGASNFPLAFSVAGGDTASALAAGCPVVTKVHPAHPGVSALVGAAIVRAAEAVGVHPGVFSMLFDQGIEVGEWLVDHPAIAGVGFTGSYRGGTALMRRAAARPVPIPVFAEMGSVNPSFLLPELLQSDPAGLAERLAGALTMGVGQFCTNPGVLVTVGEASVWAEEISQRLAGFVPTPMLTEGIAQAYSEGVERRNQMDGVNLVVDGPAHLFEVTAAQFVAEPDLHEEIFGPSAVWVRAQDLAEAEQIARAMDGQLTMSFHGTGTDLEAAKPVVQVAATKAGRVLFNQVPTGVEVCDSIVHGGPFPATSDGRSTSVGTGAIERWSRPVCWQNAPQALLPPELQDANPLALHRLVDGKRLVSG